MLIIVECGCSKVVTTIFKEDPEGTSYSEKFVVGLCEECGKKDAKGNYGDYTKSSHWKKEKPKPRLVDEKDRQMQKKRR